jgi:OOP family OmpA-OmpF porin
MITDSKIHFALLTALSFFMMAPAAAESIATTAAATTTQNNAPIGRVVISGTVPNEATKAALLAKLQEVYGPDQVVDQISVGGVIAPPNWATLIPKLINPSLKAISKGQMAIEGTTILMRGEVANEGLKSSIANELAASLNPTYTIKNGLRVTASSQTAVDQTLGNRVIEFENGSALLTPSGKRVLDEMSETLKTVKAKKIDLIGHTDDKGSRARNIALSMARAESVKTYFIAKGLQGELIATSGMGSDQPMMSNSTEEGRRRNRRIEFRVSQ